MIRLKSLTDNDRVRLTGVLVLSLGFSLALIASRAYFTGKATFFFLIWNLILAFIPFAISTLLITSHRKVKSNTLLIVGGFAWLIFFPNAPYILTDLFHLRVRTGVPIWFDLLVILSAAWNGLILGLLSLKDMQEIVASRFSQTLGWLFVLASLTLCGFGIYVGRYLRWNSWDVIANPVALASDLIDPLLQPHSLGFTFLYMLFLLIAFLILKLLSTSSSQRP